MEHGGRPVPPTPWTRAAGKARELLGTGCEIISVSSDSQTACLPVKPNPWRPLGTIGLRRSPGALHLTGRQTCAILPFLIIRELLHARPMVHGGSEPIEDHIDAPGDSSFEEEAPDPGRGPGSLEPLEVDLRTRGVRPAGIVVPEPIRSSRRRSVTLSRSKLFDAGAPPGFPMDARTEAATSNSI